LEEALVYHVLGRAYGWSPSEIQKTPAKVIRVLLTFLQATSEKEMNQRQKLENEFNRNSK